MATKKAAKSKVRSRDPRAGADKSGAAKASVRKPRAYPKENARETAKNPRPSKNRGLLIFGVLAAAVIVLAVMGKIRQGPPLKLLPCQVVATYNATGTEAALGSPRGVAVDGEGNLYVADLGNHRVVKFSPNGNAMVWGKKGAAAGEFNEPSGVAVDNRGQVYVADAWNGRIQKFNTQGEYLGEIGAKTGNFYSPRNVAVDAQGFIYVADTGNSKIKKFDADANLVKSWGEYGPGRERFQETFGVWADKNKQVYVGDAGNRRLKIFNSEGKWLREIRVKGWQTGINWPMAAVDAQGRVYAVDVNHNMIWIYQSDGKYLGSWGNRPGQEIFVSPLGIAIDAQGAVYVANMNRGEVVKLAALAL